MKMNPQETYEEEALSYHGYRTTNYLNKNNTEKSILAIWRHSVLNDGCKGGFCLNQYSHFSGERHSRIFVQYYYGLRQLLWMTVSVGLLLI